MDRSSLKFGDSSIEIHHQGAHLSSWVYQGREQLFLSRKAIIKSGKALRGGVPICFPQFGAFGPGQQHGFARNVLWLKSKMQPFNGLRFELTHNEDLLEQWPHQFKAQFDVRLENNTLSMALRVENVGSKPMEFTAALHTYFRIDEIENAVVKGLKLCEFWDNGNPFSQRGLQEESELRIDEMTDRVYLNSPERLSLTDCKSTRQIESRGFVDTVIWNPWREGASGLADMDDEEYQEMLCIESANVQTPVCLDVDEVWTGIQKITVDNI